jgi:hypothetical protein
MTRSQEQMLLFGIALFLALVTWVQIGRSLL